MNTMLLKVNDLIKEKICDDCGHDASMFMCYSEEAEKAGIAFRGTRQGLEDMLIAVMNEHQDIKDIVLGVCAFDFKDDVLNIIDTTERMEREN